MKLTIACAQYRIGQPADFAAFAASVAAAVTAMAACGAQWVVLPEYVSLEAAAAFDEGTRSDFGASLQALQAVHDDYLALAGELARRHAIHLVAGSFLVETTPGRYRNRSYLVAPDGAIVWQDKLCLTGFERAAGVIDAGDELRVFETGFGRVGIAICYDNEFPLYARAQAEAGARLILAPSCTDTEAGANRVRYGCQARAMENQVHVACAVTAGVAAWSPALDVNTGRAAIYSPVDRGFPSDGVVAMAEADQDFAIAELDLDALDRFRRDGQVGIRDDWPQQLRPGLTRAVVGKL